jgi:hypothetical protein
MKQDNTHFIIYTQIKIYNEHIKMYYLYIYLSICLSIYLPIYLISAWKSKQGSRRREQEHRGYINLKRVKGGTLHGSVKTISHKMKNVINSNL